MTKNQTDNKNEQLTASNIAIIPASYVIYTNGTTVYARNGTNGNIDYQGTDVATVVQSTINNLPNGGEIYIKTGSYPTTSNQITINISNIYLLGEEYTHLNGFRINLTGGTTPSNFVENVKIENLNLEGDANKTYNAITISGFVRNSKLSDIRFKNYNICIYCPPQISLAQTNNYNNPVYNIDIENCYANYVNSTIIAGGISDWSINSFLAEITYGVNPSSLFSQIYNIVPTSLTSTYNHNASFYLNDLGHTYISKLRIYTPKSQGGNVITLDGCVATDILECVASGGDNGIAIIGCSGLKISSQQYFSGNNGIYISTNDYDTFDILIYGKGFTTNGVNQHCIYASSSGTTAIYLLKIIGVTLTNSSQISANTYDGINFQGSNLLVSGCFIGNVYQPTNTMRYGINTNTSGTNLVTIVDNIFSTLATSPIINAAPINKIKDNLGYITENSGSSTGTGTQQTIAHGLSITPTRQQIALFAGSATANPYHSADPDGTNIYVTAANTQPWYWGTVGN